MSEKNPFELPKERLASTTSTGSRAYIYPAEVSGPLRTWRNVIHPLFLAIFILLPWLNINGHQAILFNIPDRRFAIFGLTFWGHEAPILFLCFFSFLFTIALVTALYGRVWCGWTCPQTVFVEGLFRKIEQKIEGHSFKQRRFNEAPHTTSKFAKKTLKWVIFLSISLLISHSFAAYFVGAGAIVKMVQNPPSENIATFITVLVTTGIVLFDFGWFREQFCIIACPYGRLQSVLMDENSKLIIYDYLRGEPRTPRAQATPDSGDCVNCYRCIQVCPTAIDIRRGAQMECIMCTSCIDACNEVMTKIKRSKGLIRVDSENNLLNRPTKHGFRLAVYAAGISIALASLIFVITNRNMLPIHVKRGSRPPYNRLAETRIRNQFNLTIRNLYLSATTVHISLPKELNDTVTLIAPYSELLIPAGKSAVYPIFADFSQTLLSGGNASITLHVTSESEHGKSLIQKEITLVGPL